MRINIQRILTVARPWLASVPRYALMGAWFFAIASAFPLLWLVFEGQGNGTDSRVFSTTVNEVTHSIWGLTYSGIPGMILLWLELIALVAATVMTILPGSVSLVGQHIVTRMRRIGHGYLTGWAALWMVGTIYLAAIDPGFWTLQAIFLTILFGCTLYRAIHEWPTKSKNSGDGEVEGGPIPTTAPTVSLAQTASRETAVEIVAQLCTSPTATPRTDIDAVDRFLLHRSAVRPSDRIREAPVPHDPPSRLFSSRIASTQKDEADDYGATLRCAIRDAALFVRRTTVSLGTQGWQAVKTLASAMRRSPRST